MRPELVSPRAGAGGMGAGEDEVLFGAGEGDVEQAQGLGAVGGAI